MGKFCAKCGAELKENSLFCAKCGNRVEPAVPAPAVPQQVITPTEQKPPKKKHTGLIVIGVIGAVLIVALLALCVFVGINHIKGAANADGGDTQIPVEEENPLPELDSFEDELNKAIAAYYADLGFDAESEGYLLRDYSVADSEGEGDSVYAKSISAVYGPDSEIALSAYSDGERVYSVFCSFFHVGHYYSDEHELEYLRACAIPAMLYANGVYSADSLTNFLDKIMDEPEKDLWVHSEDGIMYTAAFSDSFLYFSLTYLEGPSESETPVREETPVGEDTLDVMQGLVQGVWIDLHSLSYDGYDVNFSLCEFADPLMAFGYYPGSYDRAYEIIGAEEELYSPAEGLYRYTLSLYRPAEEYMGDWYEEEYSELFIEIDGNKIVFGENADSAVFIYAGRDMDEAVAFAKSELGIY